jgi:16S rRNA (cytidine1402-2'-O)-methyltransferase
MRAAHEYRNALTEIERARRAEVRALMSSAGNVAACEASVAACDDAVLSAARSVKDARVVARSKTVAPELGDALKSARAAKRAAVHVLREARKAARLRMTSEMDSLNDRYSARVREARAAGVNVVSIPGACAAVSALSIAGLPSDRFLFAGFLPVKDKARSEVLAGLADVAATLVFYETAPRLERSLAAIGRLWPDRELAVARELTKMHEECRTGTAVALAAHYAAHPPKGEIVLLIGPPAKSEAPVAHTDALIRAALAEAGRGKAAGIVAKTTGIDRATLYARVLELKGE